MLFHPPGWGNISSDVKIGEYSCLKSDTSLTQTLGLDLPPIGEFLNQRQYQIWQIIDNEVLYTERKKKRIFTLVVICIKDALIV